MKILLSDSELAAKKWFEKIPLECKKCGKTFYVNKKDILSAQKRSIQSYLYCSVLCRTEDNTKVQKLCCTTCGKEVMRQPSEVKKSLHGNVFCSARCAAITNNKLKPKKIKTQKIPKQREPKPIRSTCSKCDLPLTDENCYKQKRPSGKYVFYPTCKKCHSKIVMNRWISLKEKIIQDMGGKCADCGKSYSYEIYDFHHIDPTQKEYNWKEMKGFNEKKRNKELSKCILLCANCHKSRHLSFFATKEIIKPIYKGQNICLYCGTVLTNENSYGNGKHCCKKCTSKITLMTDRKTKQELVEMAGEVCQECKSKFDARLLCFHHIVPEEKNKNFHYIVKSKERMKEEMSKCVLLCENCHRLKHKELDTKQDEL